jgi:hypothetical protein
MRGFKGASIILTPKEMRYPSYFEENLKSDVIPIQRILKFFFYFLQ